MTPTPNLDPKATCRCSFQSQPSPLFSPSLTPVTVACSLTSSSPTVALRRYLRRGICFSNEGFLFHTRPPMPRSRCCPAEQLVNLALLCRS
ncbi:hypothetical protein RHMOL_Rhmol04G0154000 [Rhododendron molle]|uniref:Uncharacterized protein n=1 Tax=Rhododendron molle TaxID=49168 RepID=A0ACC0P384_RHOML|nr:hypothetical protein RHMOL_Rhmol04G0154000 [Rhododendron molle]